MTLADALAVQPKDILASPRTSPSYRPFAVKAVWVSEDKQAVRFQLIGYKPTGSWVPYDYLVRVPKGWTWSTTQGWLTESHVRGTLRLTAEVSP